jgi:hypothetical protein
VSARPLFSIGGCAYHMRVDGRVCADIAHLAASATMRDEGPRLASIQFNHTSNLPAGRMLWLRSQLDQAPRLKWAISVDSDTSFTAPSLLAELAMVDGDVALGLAPVRIGGTESLCNLCLSEADELAAADGQAPAHGRRMFAAELEACLAPGGDRRIASGGFGLAVFNLEWYRHHWRRPAPEYVSIDSGEDTEHCRSVRARGGKIIALKVRTDHFGFGEKQTR